MSQYDMIFQYGTEREDRELLIEYLLICQSLAMRTGNLFLAYLVDMAIDEARGKLDHFG